MRKILYIVLVCSALSAISCSKEALNTSPSGSLTPGQVFENSEAGQSAVDGIYHLMYTNGWCGYDSEHPGLAGFTMAHSLMGGRPSAVRPGQRLVLLRLCLPDITGLDCYLRTPARDLEYVLHVYFSGKLCNRP